jgi:hypothetical protein
LEGRWFYKGKRVYGNNIPNRMATPRTWKMDVAGFTTDTRAQRAWFQRYWPTRQRIRSVRREEARGINAATPWFANVSVRALAKQANISLMTFDIFYQGMLLYFGVCKERGLEDGG